MSIRRMLPEESMRVDVRLSIIVVGYIHLETQLRCSKDVVPSGRGDVIALVFLN